jgi:hypothetical protein
MIIPLKSKIILMITSFFLIIINSTGPLQNISGNFRARFAITKSIVEHQQIKINNYQHLIGYDQAIYKDNVYCTHNPGMSFLMIVPYVLFAKPISELFLNAKNERKKFLIEGWISKVLTVGFIFWMALFYYIKLFGLNQLKSRNLPLILVSSTLIFPYAISPFADILSALLQFPIIYFIFHKREPKNRFDHLVLFFCLLFLFLNKPTNLILSTGFLVFSILNKNKTSLIVLSLSILVFVITQLTYNTLIDGNPMTFVVQYFAPNGIAPEVAFDSYSEIMRVPELNVLLKVFFSLHEGLLVFSPSLLGLFLIHKPLSKVNRIILLSPMFLLTFLLFFRNWNLGADYGWRNGLPLIPILLYLVVKGWNESRKRFRLLKYFLCIVVIKYTLPFLVTPVIDYEARNQHNEYPYMLNRLLTIGPDSILGNTNFIILNYILIISSIIIFYYSLTYKVIPSMEKEAK